MPSTSLTIYPKVHPLLDKVPYGKRSKIINLAIYELLNNGEDIESLVKKAEQILK